MLEFHSIWNLEMEGVKIFSCEGLLHRMLSFDEGAKQNGKSHHCNKEGII